MIDKLYIVSLDWTNEYTAEILNVVNEVGLPC